MKTKILYILLLNCLLTGMSFAQCKVDSILTNAYISGTSAKEPSYTNKYKYDANDSIVGYEYKSWNNISNKWINNSKETYVLNSNGKRTQILSEVWQYNKWNKQSKSDITIDANGFETLYLNQNWDSASNSYKPTGRQFVVYMSQNKATQSLQQNWDEGTATWVNNFKTDLSYNSNGFRTGQISSRWNVDSGKWLNYFKVDWRTNNQGYALGYKFYRWECNIICQWEFSDSTQYFLNENYRDTANYRYVNGSSIQKTLTNFNSNSCINKIDYYFFDNSQMKLVIGSEDIYTYKSKSTAIAPIENSTLKVYPNPANSILTIENSEAKDIFIIDIITGQTIVNATTENGSATIDISLLNNGLYLIKLGNSIQKIIIQH